MSKGTWIKNKKKINLSVFMCCAIQYYTNLEKRQCTKKHEIVSTLSVPS